MEEKGKKQEPALKLQSYVGKSIIKGREGTKVYFLIMCKDMYRQKLFSQYDQFSEIVWFQIVHQ